MASSRPKRCSTNTNGQLQAGLLSFFSKPPSLPPPPPPSAASAINAQMKELAKHSTIAGHVRNIIAKFRISPERAKLILSAMGTAIHWEELFFFYFMGWLFVPLVLEVPNNFIRSRYFPNARPFKRSYTRLFGDFLAQASRIGFVVYIVDILKIVLQALGFKFAQLQKSPHIVARSLITLWVANRISALKRYILAMQTRNDPGDLMGSAELVDRLIDAIVYGICSFVLIDNLQADFGAAAKGFAALGGVGTIVLSLASQGLVSQVFYGLFLASSNKIRKGDVIRFGDGKIAGLIAHMGWTDTLVRSSDGVMVSVPNKVLADQSISNLSRIQISCVKQELRFKYGDGDKIPKVMDDIKDEIRKACPQLIEDGSRPFRAFWTSYGTTGLEATVEAHFRVKLLGDPFWENRQNMLIAINRAVKKNRVELVHLLDEEFFQAFQTKTK
ncbi:Mechanosensitive ion channel [Seminavis robusta]|uniref:Mechanosensitive ion channel n=1 Tax=Seminavis robusta TaxID=568900 RepID=A0A9N8H9H9_9STRA|nr:Mechanosensitive ion channel [Seminavis robusta]|eukprot:Sro206_g086660.1 Mechanosensitive ion channel (443) ;mRNA; r:68673-70227